MFSWDEASSSGSPCSYSLGTQTQGGLFTGVRSTLPLFSQKKYLRSLHSLN